jgi:uncharacterized membrane protein
MKKENVNYNSLFLKNRKGQTGIIVSMVAFALIIILLVIGVIGYFTTSITGEITTDMQAKYLEQGENTSAELLSTASSAGDNNFLDDALFYLTIASWLALLWSSYAFPDHPIFFIVLIIFFTMLIYASGEVSNFWGGLGIGDGFVKVSWLLNNLMIVVSVVTFSCMAVMGWRYQYGE